MTTEATPRPPEPIRVRVRYDSDENRWAITCSACTWTTSRIKWTEAQSERTLHRDAHRRAARRTARARS